MKKLIWKIVLAASLLLMVIAATNIALLIREYQKGINTYANLEKYATVTQDSVKAAQEINGTADNGNTEEAVEEVIEGPQIAVDLDIDYDALTKINGDFVGWIYYAPLELSYPIVRGIDNDYYTHYTFENVRNSSGAIFMDFLNKPDFSHFNTIIYGHNMRIGTMFGSLKKLLNDPSIIKEDPYIYIFTKEKVMMYEICAAYITNDSSHTYDLTQTAEEQADYVKYIRNAAAYYWNDPMLEESLNEDTRLITLSTCHGLHSNNRTVIHGVLVASKDR